MNNNSNNCIKLLSFLVSVKVFSPFAALHELLQQKLQTTLLLGVCEIRFCIHTLNSTDISSFINKKIIK